MNNLEKLSALKKLIKSKNIDKLAALRELSSIMKNKGKSSLDDESEVILQELNRLRELKSSKLRVLERVNTFNQSSSEILELLSMSDENLNKQKDRGYRLI